MNPTAFQLTAAALLTAFCTAHADSLILTNGQTVTGKSFRRSGDNIMVTTEVAGPDGKPMNAERGVPLAEIARVDAPAPPVLNDAGPLLAQGNATGALSQIEPAVAAAEAYGDLPGSPWPALVTLQAQALLAAGKDANAELAIEKLSRSADAEAKASASALAALVAARKGDHDKAGTLAGPHLPPAAKPETGAAAALARGLGLLAKKQHAEALLCFLEAPVFAPKATAFSAMSQLGAAQCYFGMADFDRAISTLESLTKTQPGSPEAKTAQTLLPEYQRRKRVINEAKE